MGQGQETGVNRVSRQVGQWAVLKQVSRVRKQLKGQETGTGSGNRSVGGQCQETVKGSGSGISSE